MRAQKFDFIRFQAKMFEAINTFKIFVFTYLDFFVRQMKEN